MGGCGARRCCEGWLERSLRDPLPRNHVFNFSSLGRGGAVVADPETWWWLTPRRVTPQSSSGRIQQLGEQVLQRSERRCEGGC